jgi:hypothetical protein
MDPAFRFICATYVRPGREKEFEDFVKDVVEPVVRKAQPELANKWTMLRPASHAPDGAEAPYVFLLSGDFPLDQWEIRPMFEAVHGSQRANELDRQFEGYLAREQLVYAVGEDVLGSS